MQAHANMTFRYPCSHSSQAPLKFWEMPGDGRCKLQGDLCDISSDISPHNPREVSHELQAEDGKRRRRSLSSLNIIVCPPSCSSCHKTCAS